MYLRDCYLTLECMLVYPRDIYLILDAHAFVWNSADAT
jgi:hypothetical protein